VPGSVEFLLALFKLVARLKLQRENPFKGKESEYSGAHVD